MTGNLLSTHDVIIIKMSLTNLETVNDVLIHTLDTATSLPLQFCIKIELKYVNQAQKRIRSLI